MPLDFPVIYHQCKGYSVLWKFIFSFPICDCLPESSKEESQGMGVTFDIFPFEVGSEWFCGSAKLRTSWKPNWGWPLNAFNSHQTNIASPLLQPHLGENYTSGVATSQLMSYSLCQGTGRTSKSDFSISWQSIFLKYSLIY